MSEENVTPESETATSQTGKAFFIAKDLGDSIHLEAEGNGGDMFLLFANVFQNHPELAAVIEAAVSASKSGAFTESEDEAE